jgi:threonine/homoserine/homoserine lactone efflux protein
MPDPSRLALFVGASLALLAVPGPAVLYIVTQSVSHGRRAGIASVAGITTGTLVHIAAATAGLSALLASSALAFDVVKYVGAAYLIVVGLRRLAGLERGGGLEERPATERSLGRLYRQGIVVNVLNPKTALFFLAFLPQFIEAGHAGHAGAFVALGALFNLGGFVVNAVVALLAGAARERLAKRRAASGIGSWLQRAAGLLFVGLGAKLALDAR